MNPQFRAQIFVLACLYFIMFLTYYITQKYEPFEDEDTISSYNDTNDLTNPGDEPWKHHKINNLTGVEYKVKYDKAYYYELDNATFEAALQKAFAPSASQSNSWTQLPMPGTDTGTLTDAKSIRLRRLQVPNLSIYDAYKLILAHISNTINSKTLLFVLPDGTQPKFQIIHDVLNNVYINEDQTKYLMQINFVCYRESKFQAKSIQSTCTIDKNHKVEVPEIHVVGVLSEDSFGLFPVVGIDPSDEYALVSDVPSTDKRF
jgi:hypothetical protein